MIPLTFHRLWFGPRTMPDQYSEYGHSYTIHHPEALVYDWAWDPDTSTLRPFQVFAGDDAPDPETDLSVTLQNEQTFLDCGTKWIARPGAGKLSSAQQVQRADIASYDLLYAQGGIYLNTDLECLKPFTDLLDTDIFLSWELDDKALSNALMAATPNHPFLQACINRLPNRINEYPGAAMNVQTGPWLLTDVYQNWEPPRPVAHPQKYFHPYLWNQMDQEASTHPDAYTSHHWGHQKDNTTLWPDLSIAEHPKVAVAYLFGDGFAGEFGTTLLTAGLNGQTPFHSVMARRSGPMIAPQRNNLVQGLLDDNDEWEWFWGLDADMTLQHDTLDRLLAVADAEHRPIVGGLCFGRDREGIIFPTMYRLVDQEGNFARAENVIPNQMVEVDATGMACILIHRTVFEKMAETFPKPYVWFQETQIGEKVTGEDITFCLRARSLGYPVYVHTGIEVGHIKHQTLDLEAHNKWREDNHFIVTGTGRSGTKFVSELLNAFTIPCGHENVFHEETRRWEDIDWGGLRGDSSWMAGAYLREATIARTKTIYHIVRHPLTTIASMLSTNFYTDDSPPSLKPWRDFQKYFASHIFNHPDPISRAADFYLTWNRRIDKYATVRYRLEDLNTPEAIKEFITHVGAKRPLDEMKYGLEATGTQLNSSHHNIALSWNDFPIERQRVSLQQMAERYGYTRR